MSEKMLGTLRQAYRFNGDPIGYYFAKQTAIEAPVTWTGPVLESCWHVQKELRLTTPVEWRSYGTEDPVPTDVFAAAYEIEETT